MEKKTLVIINGVTGAIGTAVLAECSRKANVVIHGLSRKADSFQTFLEKGYIPDKTIICSIGQISDSECSKKYIESINTTLYEKIIYIHAVGIYPFELDSNGNIAISNDDDGDGIDDRVVQLSYTAFFNMMSALGKTQIPVKALIFGGIADKHCPAVHSSWWKVMGRVKDTMRNKPENENINFFVLNISSVICPHEILTRPYVFVATNANPQFWLMPHEVGAKVVALTFSKESNRFLETDLFHKSDYYTEDYFEEDNFTERKIHELGISKTAT